MTTLKQRLLRRALPVGLATAAIGYVLLRAYLSAAHSFAGDVTIHSDGPSLAGPLIFGLVGFALTAAIECARVGGASRSEPEA
jgi:hypothetical protein